MASDGVTHKQGDWKATITFFILFVSVFAVTLPSITAFVIISLFYKTSQEPAALYVFIVLSTVIL